MVSFLLQGSTSDPPYFFVSVCGALNLGHDSCPGAGVCLVTKKGDKMYKPLGLFKNRAMTFYKDEGMLILKYCNAACDSKGRSIKSLFEPIIPQNIDTSSREMVMKINKMITKRKLL